MDLNMEIFIPSRSRLGTQTTLEGLPDLLLKHVRLVVPFEQRSAYAEEWGQWVKVSGPDIPEGIGYTRQWCIETAHRQSKKCVMLDDDLVFATRRDDDPGRFRPSTHDEIVDLFAQVETLLDSYASVGVATREGGNRNWEDLDHNTRLLRFLCFRTDVLMEHKISFEDIAVMEDFYVALSLLTRGYQNVKINHMVQNQNGSGNDGGCSDYRTRDVQAIAAHDLKRAFPDFVKVRKVSTKVAWGGGERTDVTVQWKSALKSAQEVRIVPPIS